MLVAACSWILVLLTLLPTAIVTPTLYCPNHCLLPDCFCNNLHIPGGLRMEQVPQMILFTYTGIITETIRRHLTEIFPDRLRNPNGCPVSITVFNSAQFSQDCAIHHMYVRGHEIAVGGLNRNWSGDLDITSWRHQFADHRSQLSRRSYIPSSELLGARAPLLQPGGNVQFSMLSTEQFVYDSSLIWQPSSNNDPPPWPYTMHRVKECHPLQENCPTKPFQSLWQFPISLINETCRFLDECITPQTTTEEVHQMLTNLLHRHYSTNRAPLVINLRLRLLTNKRLQDGLVQFMQDVVVQDNLVTISMSSALTWLQDPTTINEMENYKSWTCEDRDFFLSCNSKRHSEAQEAKTLKSRLFKNIHWWQFLVYAILYFFIRKYDRNLPDAMEEATTGYYYKEN